VWAARAGGNFLKECCIQKPEASIQIRELFKAYQDWCEENNKHAVSERFFGLHLDEPVSVIPCIREWTFLLFCYYDFLFKKPF
jgi:hypothetical protein